MRVRRGVTLAECLTAILIASAGLAAAAKMVSLAAGQKRFIQEYAIACDETANLAERMAAAPYDDLTDEPTDWPLSVAAQQLPDARLAVRIVAEDGAKRIHIDFFWRENTETPRQESLVFWRYR